jgi:hypothetical protein
MALDALIRSALRTADAVTAGLQATVGHAAYTSQDAYGKPTYAAVVDRQAVVELTEKPMRTLEGHERLSIARLTFPRPVAIDVRDRFTLPDGRTAPILTINGVADPSTGARYATEVALG